MTDDVPLRDYTQTQWDGHQRVHDLLAENVRTALAAQDKRLDGMNEFRASLDDVTKQGVKRDVFDIVANRLTIVENTYVPRETYSSDVQAQQVRLATDFQSRDMRLQELEKNSIPRATYLADLKARDDRIAKLESDTVRQGALDTQKDEVARTRKALVFTIAGGVVLMVINFIVNAVQVAQSATP